VGNVGKSRRFLAGLFQAAVGIRAFCGFPRTRHFPSGHLPIHVYPQISLKIQKIQALRPNWKTSTIEELRENVNEYQLIEVSRDLGLCGKTEGKAFLGLLNKRNECAHPSGYFPGLNESLGYISEVLQRIDQLRLRTLKSRKRKNP
jgi:hypothetical protein